MMENRAEHFRRTAKERVNEIVHALRLLGDCSVKRLYAYSPEQVEQIFSVLQAALDKTKKRFESQVNKRDFLSDSADQDENNMAYSVIVLPLPDGTRLQAVMQNDVRYPAIYIYLEQEKGTSIPICFAEYNPEHPGRELHIGAYQSELDDPTYYAPYEREER